MNEYAPPIDLGVDWKTLPKEIVDSYKYLYEYYKKNGSFPPEMQIILSKMSTIPPLFASFISLIRDVYGFPLSIEMKKRLTWIVRNNDKPVKDANDFDWLMYSMIYYYLVV